MLNRKGDQPFALEVEEGSARLLVGAIDLLNQPQWAGRELRFESSWWQEDHSWIAVKLRASASTDLGLVTLVGRIA